jgi:hypothetical protein
MPNPAKIAENDRINLRIATIPNGLPNFAGTVAAGQHSSDPVSDKVPFSLRSRSLLPVALVGGNRNRHCP